MFSETADLATARDTKKLYERINSLIQNSAEAVYCVEMEVPLPIHLPEEQIIDLLYRNAYLADVNDAYARMVGQKKEELLGLRLTDFLPRTLPENLDFLKKTIAAKFNVTDFETVETYGEGKTGVYLNNFSADIENGLLCQLWGTARDITEKKRLEKELRQSEKDLQKLAGRLIYKQENELRRLARELHDNLTQQLAVLAIEVGKVENHSDAPEPVRDKMTSIKDQLIRVSKEVHNLSRDLHPSIIDDLGLVRAIQSECNNFSSRTGLPVIVKVKDVPAPLSVDTALALYRIVQEGLSNAFKHAEAKNIYVFLEGQEGKIVLMVRDTGIGFKPEEVRHKQGLGLSSIRERVRLIGGELSIKSKPGKGTSVEVSVPLKNDKV